MNSVYCTLALAGSAREIYLAFWVVLGKRNMNVAVR